MATAVARVIIEVVVVVVVAMAIIAIMHAYQQTTD